MTVPVWTPPTSFIVGHIETSAELNPLFSGNMEFLHAAKRFRIYRATSAQSIPNNTLTAVAFNAEDADPWNGHDNATNPSRWTCPSALAGVWRIRAQAQFASNATGIRSPYVYKTGVENVVGPARVAVSGGVTIVAVSCEMLLASGDYPELKVTQTSGGALNVDFGSGLTFMEGEWLGAVVS